MNSLALHPAPKYLGSMFAPDGNTYQAIAHRQSGILVLEFERRFENGALSASSIFGYVHDFMGQLALAPSTAEIAQTTVCEVRRLTGFDRVLIYRFDDDWNGMVIAEDRNEELPAYLDLRFPASDIPAQARKLYRLNRIRIISDSRYVPVPIEPAVHPRTGQHLDLTYSVLRSVSPVHLQYMNNMGTGSSMSISVIRDGALWGLVSCHSRLPRQVSFELRSACDMIAQVLSWQLAAAEHRADSDRRTALNSTRTELLAHLAEEDNFLEALTRHSSQLLACTESSGAAIVLEAECRAFGRTPDEGQLRELTGWLGRRASDEPVFVTDSLGGVYEPARQFEEVASGVLAVGISSLHDSYLLWFRPEAVQTVRWGGDPSKPVAPGAAGRLNPRNSFEVWKEQVRGRSRQWSVSEIDSAVNLRQAIVRIVLRSAEELAQLSVELRRSNQELESFSSLVLHDLRAPFRHIVGFSELLQECDAENLSVPGRRYLGTIIDSAHFAGTLVDNLLSFSQVARASLHYTDIDVLKVVDEAREAALVGAPGRSIEWRIGVLPHVHADLFMLRLVFQNLISNALKYTRPRATAIVEVFASHRDEETTFTIRDNGVGFDPRYGNKLFGIFQRLHKMEEFEGTGIGLANVRRIITRHGGRTWAAGALDEGAAFSFTLPDTWGENRSMEGSVEDNLAGR